MFMALCTLGLLSSSVLAVYYRHQADEFRKQLVAVEDRARQAHESLRTGSRNEPPATVKPISQQAGTGAADHAARQTAMDQQNRIRQLEAALYNKDTLILSLQQAATNRPADPSWSRHRQQARLDDLKQTNPRQYEDVIKRREQVRQEIQTSFAEKEAYFGNSDPSNMSEEEQAAYQQMAQLLDETRRLTEQMRAGLPPNERQAVMQTLQQNRSELAPMLDAARSKEWVNLGIQLGYNDEDAQAFGNYINKVIDLTSMQSIYRSMRAGIDPRAMQNPASPSTPASAH